MRYIAPIVVFLLALVILAEFVWHQKQLFVFSSLFNNKTPFGIDSTHNVLSCVHHPNGCPKSCYCPKISKSKDHNIKLMIPFEVSYLPCAGERLITNGIELSAFIPSENSTSTNEIISTEINYDSLISIQTELYIGDLLKVPIAI